MKIQELRGVFASFNFKGKQNFAPAQNQSLNNFKPKLNLLKADTVSFLAKCEIIPIYVSTTDGSTITRYDDINIAANRISTSRDNIQHQLKGKTRTTDGLFIFYAKDIDLLDENGNPVLDEFGQPKMDKEKFDKLYQEKLSKINQTITPVYIMKTNKTGLKRFDDINPAAGFLQVNRDRLVCQLNGNGKTTAGHFVFKAQDVETIDANGKPALDEKKLNELLALKLKTITIKNPAVYIVSIDGTESYRFDSPDLAADKLTVGINSVFNQMNDRRKSVKGFFVIKAQDVEKPDKEGKINLDEALFDKIYQAKLEALASIKKSRKIKTKT